VIRATSRQEINKAQADFQELLASKEPWRANLEAATLGHDPGLLVFRGLTFLVPPVPYRPGQAIHALTRYLVWLRRELKKLEDKGRFIRYDKEAARYGEEIVNALEELTTLYRSLVRPRGLKTRWALRGGRDPFEDPTEQEVDELADFFHHRRTTSSVRAVRSIRAFRFLHSTWSPSARPLLQGIPPALRRKVFHAAGNISKLEMQS
jgi:hypothetical protein